MKINELTSMTREQEQLYNDYFAQLQEAVRVDTPDKERTAELVEAAKGAHSIRSFSNLVGVNPSSLSRIMSGQVGAISLELLARIAVCAAPTSNVTLDALMDAQGLALRRDLSVTIMHYVRSCRRILADELLSRGYSVSYSEKPICKTEMDDICDFSITTNALTGTDKVWFFDAKLLRGERTVFETRGARRCFMSYMAFYYRGGHAGRISMVVNQPDAFAHIKQMASATGPIPDEISIMLVSLEEGRLTDEYILPLTDGRTAQRLIDMEDVYDA